MRNWITTLGALVALAACGGDAGSSADSAGFGGDSPHAAGDDGPAAGSDGEPIEEPFVPEVEVAVDLQVPQGGERFVFVTSSGLDALVRIDAISLDVELIEVGAEPTVARTLGGEEALLVVNEGTRDFSVVRGADEDSITVSTLDAPSAVNRLQVTPDGLFAVAWFDPEVSGPLGDLQQVLVLQLTPSAEAVQPVGVGFHPLSVTFHEDGTRAFVVTEDGVSVIDMASLTGPSFVPTVAVTPDPLEPWFDREVLVTPDGERAIVRRGGVSELRIIELATGAVEIVPLDGPPTDADLTPGAGEVLVVIRDTAQLVRVPLGGRGGLPVVIDLSGTPAGLANLTPDGQRAVLYSTLPGNRWVGVLTLSTGAVAVHKLQKDVEAVAPAPDGESVLIIHQKEAQGEPEAGEPLSDFLAKSEGYSVLDVETGFAKLVLLDHEPLTTAITPDGDHAWVLIPDPTGASHEVDAIDLRTLLVTPLPMGSAPQHAIFLPAASRVAITQKHPVGRITFVGTASGETETVTGFELNGLIK